MYILKCDSGWAQAPLPLFIRCFISPYTLLMIVAYSIPFCFYAQCHTEVANSNSILVVALFREKKCDMRYACVRVN